MIIPKKISIANIPTPVQKTEFAGCKFLIKRDDLTGVELTGNKVRKLEYLLAEAKKQNCDYVFTSGGDQSNHARATAIAAASNGFKSKLFLWGNSNQNADGNLFLDKLVGAEIKFLNKKDYHNVDEIMEAERQEFAKKKKKAFVIPSGGSSPLGIWGYINFIKELSEQIDINKISGILIANGSCGTAAGMLVGSALLGIKLKVYSVNVLMTEEEVFADTEKLVKDCVANYKLNINVDLNNLNILDGYSKEGYKKITKEKIEVIKQFFRETGILLDPVYTGKAFFAYYQNFLKDKKNSKVLFLHTGGIFGAFAKKNNYLD